MIRNHVSDLPGWGVIENYTFTDTLTGNISVLAARKSKDQISSSSAPVTDETGHKAWSAMPLLCHFLLSPGGRRILNDGVDVLELGSGLGVPGLLIAQHLQCGSVTLSDFNPRVLECLSKSATLNQTKTKHLGVVALDWNKTYPTDGRKYGVVVASDVIYSPESAEIFLRTARSVVKDSGVIVFSHGSRWSQVDHQLHLALERMTLQGWKQNIHYVRSFSSLTLPIGACVIVLSRSLLKEQEGEEEKEEENEEEEEVLLGMAVNEWTIQTIEMKEQDHKKKTFLLRLTMEDLEWVVDNGMSNLKWAATDAESCCQGKGAKLSIELMLSGPRPFVSDRHASALSMVLSSSPFSSASDVHVSVRDAWMHWTTLATIVASVTATFKSFKSFEVCDVCGLFEEGVGTGQEEEGTRSPANTGPFFNFMDCLPFFDHLHAFSLNNISLGNNGIEMLFNYFSASDPLRVSVQALSLSNNDFTSIGAFYISKLLQFLSNTLIVLDVSSNTNIGADGCAEIAECLPDLHHLTCLNLSGCGLGDTGLQWLAQSLPSCVSLNDLRVASNGLTTIASTGLSKLSLCSLDLSCNNIDGSGMRELVVLIEEPSTLSRLDVHGNRNIGDEGLSALSDTVTKGTLSPRLEWLDMSDVGVTSEGVKELVEALVDAEKHRGEGQEDGLPLKISLEKNDAIGEGLDMLHQLIGELELVRVELSQKGVGEGAEESGFGL